MAESRYCKRCDMRTYSKKCPSCGGNALTEGDMIDKAELQYTER